MWKVKQNVIDIDTYLSKPIANCPMDTFPHFHWMSIDGIIPNISENFIRELIETKKENLSNNDNNNLKLVEEKNKDYYGNIIAPDKSIVIKPVIHNISKELQIFLENFELRFRKEIRRIITEFETEFSPEIITSIYALKSQPGLVELLPYILEFLMTNFSNKQVNCHSMIISLIVKIIHSIIDNFYFNITPYLHQIVVLLLSIINKNQESPDKFTLEYKIEASLVVLKIYRKFEFLHTEFIKHLLEIIIKSLNNTKLISLFGSIIVSCF